MSALPVSRAGVDDALRQRISPLLDFTSRRSAAFLILLNASTVVFRCTRGKQAICHGKSTQDEFSFARKVTLIYSCELGKDGNRIADF